MVAARRSNLFAHILIWQLQVTRPLFDYSLFSRLSMQLSFFYCHVHILTALQLQGEEPPSSDDIKEEHAVEVWTHISLVGDETYYQCEGLQSNHPVVYICGLQIS